MIELTAPVKVKRKSLDVLNRGIFLASCAPWDFISTNRQYKTFNQIVDSSEKGPQAKTQVAMKTSSMCKYLHLKYIFFASNLSSLHTLAPAMTALFMTSHTHSQIQKGSGRGSVFVTFKHRYFSFNKLDHISTEKLLGVLCSYSISISKTLDVSSPSLGLPCPPPIH